MITLLIIFNSIAVFAWLIYTTIKLHKIHAMLNRQLQYLKFNEHEIGNISMVIKSIDSWTEDTHKFLINAHKQPKEHK